MVLGFGPAEVLCQTPETATHLPLCHHPNLPRLRGIRVAASVGVLGCWYYVAAYRFDALVQMAPVLVKPRISSAIRGEISSLWFSDIAKIAHAVLTATASARSDRM